ncbi:hypothetical protein LBMAG52_31840 [Planctomycetia bacterium]|nr:hypothetical protein LBMAG52_31840 [Planctomycetia bacterium]
MSFINRRALDVASQKSDVGREMIAVAGSTASVALEIRIDAQEISTAGQEMIAVGPGTQTACREK